MASHSWLLGLLMLITDSDAVALCRAVYVVDCMCVEVA